MNDQTKNPYVYAHTSASYIIHIILSHTRRRMIYYTIHRENTLYTRNTQKGAIKLRASPARRTKSRKSTLWVKTIRPRALLHWLFYARECYVSSVLFFFYHEPLAVLKVSIAMATSKVCIHKRNEKKKN